MNEPIRLIIITVPPPAVAAELETLRRALCDRYRAPWALAYPPHVTLRTGVLVPPEAMPAFLGTFGTLFEEIQPFPIRTEAARCGHVDLEGRRQPFVFLPVIQDDSLRRLHRTLLAYRPYCKSDKTHFEPHLTLLCDELTPEDWQALQAEVRDAPQRFGKTYTWPCDNVALFVQDGPRWVPFHVYELGASPVRTGTGGHHDH